MVALNTMTKAQLVDEVKHLRRRIGTLEKPAAAPGDFEQLKRLAEHMPLYLAWKDRDGTYLGCNKNQARAIGLDDPAEIVGKTDFDLPWTRAEAELYRAGDRRVMRTGKPLVNREATQRRADGTVMTIVTNKVPLRDARGRIKGVISIFADITEQRRAEAALRKSEADAVRARADLENALESIGEGFALYDADERLVLCNKRYRRMWGLIADRIVPGVKFRRLCELVWDNGMALGTDLSRRKWIAHRLGDFRKGKNVIERQLAEKRRVLITERRTRDGGVVSIVTDITVQKRAEDALAKNEAHLQHLLATSPAVIYTARSSGDYGATYISENIKRQLGYAPKDFTENSAFWAENIHPDDAQRVFDGLPKLFENGEHAHEYRFRVKDGRYRWMRDELRLIRDDDGEPTEIAGFWVDITERKHAEEALRESEARSRAVLDTIIDGIITIDSRGTIQSFNPAATKIFGYTADEVIGKNVKLLMPRSEARRHDGYIGNFLNTGDAKIIGVGREVEGRRKDGTKFPLDLAVTEVEIAGEPMFTGVIRDITDRLRAEEALRRAHDELEDRVAERTAELAAAQEQAASTHARLNEAIETMAEGFALFDAADRLVMCNDKYRQFFPLVADIIKPGVKFETLIRTSAKLEQNILETDKTQRNWARRRIAAHKKAEGVFEHRLADGRWMLVNEHKTPDGHTISTYTDVSALKTAEARLLDAIESIPDGFALYDAEDRLVLCNARYKEIYAKHADLLVPGKTFEDMLRGGVERGEFKEAIGREEDWIAERLASHVNSPGPIEQELSDGRWLRLIETRTSEGGIVGLRTDITGIKQAEQRAEDAHARLLDAIESIPDGFILYDPDERFVLCNSNYRDYYPSIADKLVKGASLEDVARAGAERGQILESRDDSETWLQTRLRQYRTGIGSHEQHLADGRWLLCSERRTEDGHVVGIRTDITALKRNEAALRESEAQIRLIADNLPVLITFVGNDRRYRFVNETGARWYGRKPADIVGKSLQENLGSEYGKYEPHVEDVLAGEMQSFEETIDYPDGKTRNVFATLVPHIVDNGKVQGYFALVEDITERKRNEERFQKYFQLPLVGSAIYAPDKTWIEVNDALCEILGYSREELTELNWADVTHPDDLDANIRLFDEAVAGKRDTYSIDKRFIRKDGGVVHARISVQCLRKADGSPDYFILLLQDTTEQMEAEDRLRQALKSEAIGQLTGGVAHDFNNLLGIILGNVELLEERVKDDEKSRALAESAIQASLRGAELTHRLLAFARQQPLNPLAVDANGLVSGILTLLRRTFVENIEIETHLADDAWPVLADAGQLENAIINLSINSRDAMPAGGRLTIATGNIVVDGESQIARADLAPGDYVTVAVGDTGGGIPGAVLERVFDPFFTTKEVGKGTGLGLSMVYGFVKQSGGHVGIDTDPGRGTVVTLYLPRAPDAASDGPAEATPAMPLGRHETILVVEDDPDLRVTATTLLVSLGYKVLDATDARAALAILAENEAIDLLFTDVVMPGGMNGRELVDEARRLRPALSVLLTTGYSDDAVAGGGGQHPDSPTLSKPYSMQGLAFAIRGVLDRETAPE